MSKFEEPAQRVVQEAQGYVDAQIENVKLRAVKGLSVGTSSLAGLLLIFAVLSVLLLTFSFACVMWLGEILGSYSLAAFIVAGVLLLILGILLLLRKSLFKNSFIPMYTDVMSPENAQFKTQEELDKEILHGEAKINKQEALVTRRFLQAQNFYTPSRMLNYGLSKVAGESGKKTGGSFSLASLLPAFLNLFLKRK